MLPHFGPIYVTWSGAITEAAMPYYASRPFGRRLSRLERKHRRLARGGVTVLRSDGLMVLRPRRFGFLRLFWFIAFAAAALVTFKAVVYVADGPISYQARLDRLAAGTGPEAVTARVMEVDPATQFVIDNAEPHIDRALQMWREFRPVLEADNWGSRT